jgi:DNA-binding NtrC family response regulator
VPNDGRFTGGIVHVKLIEPGGREALDAGTGAAAQTRIFLPGLVGSGALWLSSCHQVDTIYGSAEWLALQGETGTGKLAVVRAVHQRRNPAGLLHVLDAADAAGQKWLAEARSQLLENQGTLVIRHVDRLSALQLRSLTAVLQDAVAAGQQDSLRVVVTMSQAAVSDDLTELLRFFPSTVELPPLRHHIEDLHELVPFFLAKLSQQGQQGRLSCSPEAMQLLLRSNWPGNTEQLWQVMRRVVQHRRSGSIRPNDLPPECWTVSRRLLSPLESMERDAIVQSLLAFEGNKVKAAESLGMSRATIYRKIHEYGIVTPAS